MLDSPEEGERLRRMPLKADALLLLGGQAWSCAMIDISATGLSLVMPDGFSGRLDDYCRVEVLLEDKRSLTLVGKIVRAVDQIVGIEFTQIPERSELALWTLLGEFADWVEGLEE